MYTYTQRKLAYTAYKLYTHTVTFLVKVQDYYIITLIHTITFLVKVQDHSGTFEFWICYYRVVHLYYICLPFHFLLLTLRSLFITAYLFSA